MTCFLCKGDMQDSTTLHTVQLSNGSILVIKNVPCKKCTQCGEVWISGQTAKKLEEIADMVSNTLSEITLIDYNSQVA